LNGLKLKNRLLIVLIIAVCTAVFITHWPALSGRALIIDDRSYFVDNYLVRNPGWDSLKKFITEVREPSSVRGYYQPLTMISLMLDYALGGQSDSLRPFHQTGLAIHIANTAFVIILLYQLFGQAWIAAALGLLFGMHPLTVEPVAWLGERKTLLAAFFTFSSLILYVRYVHKYSLKSYIGCALMYALALLSKPTSTLLPVLLLLLDFWPLKRLNRRTILEKIPLFIIGGISSVVTYVSQNFTLPVNLPNDYGFIRVPFFICHNIIFYLSKMFWPVNLSPYYPYPSPLVFSNPMILIGVIGTCVLIPSLIISLKWTRAVLTGWLIFFVMIFPTMQIMQFSDVVAADKFAYLPAIGILMTLAAFLIWLCRTESTRRYIAISLTVLILAGVESFASRRYLACWQDNLSLFKHMVNVTPDAVSPNKYLGIAFAEIGDTEQAVEYFKKVLTLDYNDADARANLGKICADQGRYDEAMDYYNEALRLEPNESETYNHIAVIFTRQGRIDEAIAVYRQGLEHNTIYPSVLHTGLGTLLFQQGRIDEAMNELETAVKLKPDATALNNLGVAFASIGNLDGAIECYKKVIGLNPKNAETYYNIGNIYLAKNMYKDAENEYKNALSLNPGYAKAYGNLGIIFAQQGNLDKAIEYFEQAAKIEPDNIGVRYNLAMTLINKGSFKQAADEYRQILRLAPQDAGMRCMLGDVLVKLGRYEEAAAEYEQVLVTDPNNTDARYALDKLKVQK